MHNLHAEKMIIPGKRLGCKAPIIDPRTLKLKNYNQKLTTLVPVNSGLISAVSTWPMFLNDILSDCAEAAWAHMIEQWTQYAGKFQLPTDAYVLDLYEAVTGYNPDNPASDQGTILIQLLNYLRKQGLITAYMAIDWTNRLELQQAIYYFGGAYLGFALPISAQNPVTDLNGLPAWLTLPNLSGANAPGSWGGHCVPILGYGVDNFGHAGVRVCTWSQLYDMTYGFLNQTGTECYAIVTPDWIEADGISPTGLNTTQLLADLQLITQ
jgi:hypothetical protein